MSTSLIGFALVHLGAPRSFRVDSGSRGFTRVPAVVVEFFRVRVGLLGRVRGSSGVEWVNLGASSGRRVHSCSRRFSRRVHSGSLMFTCARLWVVGSIRVFMGSLVRA